MKIVFWYGVRVATGVWCWQWEVNGSLSEWADFPLPNAYPQPHEVKIWFDDFLKRTTNMEKQHGRNDS